MRVRFENISSDQQQRLISQFRACCPNGDEDKAETDLQLSKTEVSSPRSPRVVTLSSREHCACTADALHGEGIFLYSFSAP